MDYKLDRNRIEHYGSLDFLAKQVVAGFITGLHKSPFHGFSVEFAEHRQYNQGESIKHIDWKLYGRTDRLYTKRFEEETNLRCQFILDHSSSMYFPVLESPTFDQPNKITFSIYAIAALMHMLKGQRDAVGLSVFSDKIELQTEARSSSVHHKYLIGNLEKMLQPAALSERRNTLATEALHEIAERIHKRSLVIIFSDMMDSGNPVNELFTALQHLRYNKHEVILFHVVEKTRELDFEYENRPYRFIDMETGEEVRLNPFEVRDEYVKTVTSYRNELKLRCAKYRIDFVEADINKGFDQILLPYLLKREKLY
ncbi:MAG: DUF58 domain-containing protein [Bacteroidales bacterium]|nr:DUF58 domain-containing protein [Lentimicrobiaceae bacterium]MDD5694270.1 DUF58 domain-containing protein [Bacteroidales bacterium]